MFGVAPPPAIAGSTWTSPAWWSLGISLLSLLVAGLSLLWNIYSFKMSGRSYPEVDTQWMVREAESFSPYVIVRVTNSGRGDSSLSKIYFTAFRGRATARGATEGDSLPFGLAAGAEQWWTFNLATILDDLNLNLDEMDNISTVSEFGDGTTRKTRLPPTSGLLRLMGSSMWRNMENTESRHATDQPPD